MFLAILYLIIIIVMVVYLKKFVLSELKKNNNRKSFIILYVGIIASIIFVGLFVNQISSVFIDLTDVFYKEQ